MASTLNTPTIFTGTAPATVNIPGVGRRELLLENLSTTDGLTFTFNDGTGVWTLGAGKAIGLFVTGGVLKVVLTAVSGAPAYQLLVYG